MKRRTFDLLASVAGLFLAAVLVMAGSLLYWAHDFVGDQVHSQLAAQQIYFPAKDSKGIIGAEYDPVREYAGQQLTTGPQAKAYADHYIAIHIQKIGDGKTYAQLSAQAQANPTDAKLAASVQSVFRGETLRGLLLNAYAFDTMAMIAGIAAIAAYLAGAVMLLLGLLGLRHSRDVEATEDLLAPHQRPKADFVTA
ncbi:MAG TPA: hypothetical protein VGB75_09485 [Jatrophihabitans sp.]|uniref:hypothetical protein n=1 Tax=Jatrophihabitans sp. TaxID=1932789 RepID=UPI002EE93269